MSFEEQFLNSLKKSPTSLHFIHYSKELLLENGFIELKEEEIWNEIPSKFFVTRKDRSLIAINKTNFESGLILSCNSDSTGLRTKPKTKLSKAGCEQLRIAPYGKGLWTSWLDRDLKIAGQIYYKSSNGEILSKLFETENAIGIIPSLAVHLSRTSGLNPTFNLENHFYPIIGLVNNNNLSNNQDHGKILLETISKVTNIEISNIIDFDIHFCDLNPPKIFGISNDLIISSRLETLSTSIPTLLSFSKANSPKNGLNTFVIYDSHEIGSNTRFGAKSNFLKSVFQRINVPENFYSKLLFIGLDGLPSFNPNFNSLISNDIILGSGIYYIDNFSKSFIIKTIIENSDKAEVSLNNYNFENNELNLISNHLNPEFGCPTITIGIPILSNHSIRETAKISDIKDLYKFLTTLLN